MIITFWFEHWKKIVGLGALLIWGWIFLPTAHFPQAAIVSIEPGLTLDEVAMELTADSVIRSPLVFNLFARLFGGGTGVGAGDYFFSHPLSTPLVAWRLARQDFGIDPVRVTIPEGSTVAEIASILERKLERIDAEDFVALAKDQEGYLFPDTYFFSPYAPAWRVINAMEENYEQKVGEWRNKITESGFSEHEILTLASIIEKEAYRPDVRRVISGILHRRLEAGMPLQVDAVFPYIIQKNTFELTLEDLDVDSPYNTYRYAGLPPGPINNPSLDSIVAALEPTETDYWFYLSDLQGNTHYAVDFDGHKANKSRYLP